MGVSHLLSIFLGLWVLLAACESDPPGEPVCNATVTERVQYEYSTAVVSSEHIVTFKGYFPKSTRDKYVSAALNNAGVSIYHTV